MRVTNNAMCFEANHPYISLTLNKTMGSHQSACWACIGKMRSLYMKFSRLVCMNFKCLPALNPEF